MAFASDDEHLEYAAKDKRVVVTADRDFLRLDAEWRATGKFHAGIIYIPRELQGVIGLVVEAALFLHQAVEMDAAKPEELYNQVWRITRKGK